MNIDEFLGIVNNDECPFSNLKLSDDWNRLSSLDERSECPKCKKSRKYFCYTCFLPVPELVPYVPKLEVSLFHFNKITLEFVLLYHFSMNLTCKIFHLLYS